ncbi:MAG: tRNA uridine(34) 5-carboxymethylaminomethyl modification radical SAM/GNAT enzyme Elp3 [Nanoarchaeota archaeon]
MDVYIKELIEIIKKEKPIPEELAKLKIKLSRKHKIRHIPTNIEILMKCKEKDRSFLKKHLITKPVRTMSGVAVVAIMTKPMKCPHGKCSMCPGGVGSVFGSVPQSYTGKEPATRRAIRNNFDPYMQIFNRLEQYVLLGQTPDKTELIIMGGTFPSFPRRYQDDFVKFSFKAMNDFSKKFFPKEQLHLSRFKKFFELPGIVQDPERTKKIQSKVMALKNKAKTTLEKEQKRNEKAKIKCVGMTIETRPDYGMLKDGNEMLRLGATRVELGVQSVYNSALKNIDRGHTVQDSIDSIRTLKDLGFKLNFHYMLGMPSVSKRKDVAGFKKLFSKPDFRPDMLKIYPLMVLKGTKLYDKYKKGKFKPINTKKAAEIVIALKKIIPKYCRIMRVQRDIPTYMTEAGVDRTNLRQYIHEIMKKKKRKCNCIRCREIKGEEITGKVTEEILEYSASQGKEFFISMVNNDKLLGFCRMRFPSQQLRKEITKDSAIIRELHVYGSAVSVGKQGKVQHKGLGRKLLKSAELIAKKNKKKKMLVISGIGVREYYRKFSYKKEGVYMVKKL